MPADDAEADRHIARALDLLQRSLTDPDPRLLNACVELYVRALAVTPADHAIRDRSGLLSNLAIAYRLKFDRAGTPADLDRAVEVAEEAVAATPPDHAERTNSLFNLAEMYLTRFHSTLAPQDLDHAYALVEDGMDNTGSGHPKWLQRLLIAARVRRAKYERDDDLWALQQTVYAYEDAVRAAPADDPQRTTILASLGFAYTAMYERSGDHEYLKLVIAAFEEVVAAVDDDPERPHMLSNLGAAYQRRYEHTGDLEDLERASAALEEAVASSRPAQGGFLSNLGSVYAALYDHTGILAHLQRAVEAQEQAIAAAPFDDPERAGMLANLGAVYQSRFTRTRDPEDLRQAVSVGEMTIAFAPRAHPAMNRFLSTLGNAYLNLSRATGSPEDLDQAVSVTERAVECPTQNIVDEATALANLASCHLERHSRTGEQADLDRAIAAAERSLAVAPADFPLRATYLGTLAAAYSDRFDATGERPATAEIRALADRIPATASPEDRIRAHFLVGSLAHVLGEAALAVELLDRAVGLLPSDVSLPVEWSDREHRLTDHTGLVREAIAAHCTAGDPAGAVAVAEAGRGILLGAELDSRTDLTELAAAEPGLADRFRQVRAGLDQPGPRQALWAEHDALLAEIRAVPGFHRFLMPPGRDELQAAVSEGAVPQGAVVMVNVAFRRSDAVIVTAGSSPTLVPLPDLTVGDMVSYASALLAGDFRRLPETLDWLAGTVVEPVLDAVPGNRVWWLPTGVIGMFPLHAVALDRAVSSYIPTLRALAHTRSRPRPALRRQLTVAMRHTPGLSDLPGAAGEAAELNSFHLADADAIAGRVLPALTAHTWAHFACHASAHVAAPSQGGLHLHDRLLTLPEIARLRLPDAELAYLSACSTANSGLQAADEALHLASAFQLAGFRHVIGTLWPLNDTVATIAAREFYRRMPDGPTADRAAEVLHEVVRELRDAYPGQPELWAALIHSGP